MAPLLSRGSDMKSRTALAYNAAADTFDHPALGFWEKFGRITVERAGIRPEMRVLDACCGSGASALPAAEAVGPLGRVVGVDLAYDLLRLAREKAAARGLTNTRFRLGDVENLGFADGNFDAVLCVFGIYFLPDMARATREMWRMVAPGGVLAITTWGPDLFEPADSLFWNSVRRVRPDLYKSFRPWDQINDEHSLRGLFRAAGIEDVVIDPREGSHTLRQPEDWWQIVMGSGYRGTADQLTPGEQREVHREVVTGVKRLDLRAINAGVVYAVAKKPARVWKAGLEAGTIAA